MLPHRLSLLSVATFLLMVGAPSLTACAPTVEPTDRGPLTGTSFYTDPWFYDVALDTTRDQLFLSYGDAGTVNVVSLESGAVTTVATGFRAQHLHFHPWLDHVLVS